MKLSVGDKAPEFEGLNQNGELVKLTDFAGKKVVLYFYPKNNTPTCTTEACNIRDNFAEFQNKGYIVLGISTDGEKSHQNFIKKHELPFSLISDKDQKIHEQFGTWIEKKMYGKTYMGTARWTFVIDENGTIEKIIDKVKAKEHTAQIMA